MITGIAGRFGLLLLVTAFVTPAFGAADSLRGGAAHRTAARKSRYNKRKLSADKQRILDHLPEGNPHQRKSIRRQLQAIQDRERIAKRIADRQNKAIQKDADRRFRQSEKDEAKDRSSRGRSSRSRR
jgi:hypothetical protein